MLAAEYLVAGRAILAYFATFADEKGRVPGPVALSTTMLLELCGEARVSIDGHGRSRAYVVAMRRMLELGVVTIHVDYSNGRHGRSYCFWYAFGSGQISAAGATAGAGAGVGAGETGRLSFAGADAIAGEVLGCSGAAIPQGGGSLGRGTRRKGGLSQTLDGASGGHRPARRLPRAPREKDLRAVIFEAPLRIMGS